MGCVVSKQARKKVLLISASHCRSVGKHQREFKKSQQKPFIEFVEFGNIFIKDAVPC